MNVVFVLTTRFLKFMDFLKVKECLKDTVFVMICAKPHEKSLSSYNKLKQYFDEWYEVGYDVLSPKDPLPLLKYQEVKQVIKDVLGKKKYQSVKIVCLDEGNLLSAAKLRGELNIHGDSEEQIMVFRDKMLMKRILSESQILVPKNCRFNKKRASEHSKEYYLELLGKLGKRFILKPNQHVASFGIYIIDDYAGFKKASEAISHFKSGYEAEEFIDGELYQCDAVINDREVQFIQVCKYSEPGLDFVFGKNIMSIILQEGDLARTDIINFTKKCLKALDARNGVYHLELFKTEDNKLVFIEVAARSPGSLIILMYEKSYHVNIASAEFLLKCGIDFSIRNEPRLDTYTLCATFPIKKGKVVKLVNPEIISPHEIFWAVKKGDTLGDVFSMADHSCMLMANNDDYDVLQRDLETLKQYSPIIVE